MSRLPRLTGGEVIAALEKAGFVVVCTEAVIIAYITRMAA